jgi:hypothetical protein
MVPGRRDFRSFSLQPALSGERRHGTNIPGARLDPVNRTALSRGPAGAF